MNSKFDDKAVERPAGDRPARTVLRLVPRDEREQRQTDSHSRQKLATDRNRPRPPWNGDDDPGPTAA